MPSTAGLPSKVGTSPFAALLQSVCDLVLQVAGLMIAAELAPRCFVELRENIAQFLGIRITGSKTLSVNLTQRADESISVLVADFAVVVAVAIGKWARALRYAAATKPDDESIKKFIKRKGGINACASRYAEYVRRPGKV